MESLKKALDGRTVWITNTQKLFYKKFPYRIVLELGRYEPKTEKGKSLFSQWPQQAKWDHVYLQVLESLQQTKGEWKHRQDGDRCSIYFLEEEDAAAFVELHRDAVWEITAPKTGDHLEAMTDTQRRVQICVRKNLFWRKYRWCVVMKPLTADRCEDTRAWAEEAMLLDDDRMRLDLGRVSKVYFNSETDALLFYFGRSEDVDHFQKVLLEEEIANEPEALAEASREADRPLVH